MARKNFSKYVKGRVQHSFQLGTLGANAAIGSSLQAVTVDSMRCSSLKATWTLSDLTGASEDGPITVGVAHSDYTNAEIEAFIESTASWDIGDMGAREVRRRLIRVIGTFPSAGANDESVVLNDGKPVNTKLNWLLAEGDTLKPWAYNNGASALASTDPRIGVVGHANLWIV